MKCAVAIVLALVGAVVSNPVHPIGFALPATSYSHSYVNHGLTYPRVVVTAPIVHRVISTPIIPTPIIKTPILPSWGYGDYGLARTYGSYGLGGHVLGSYGLGGYGWGKLH